MENNEYNECFKIKFDEKDIFKALGKISPESRKSLLSLDFKTIFLVANSEECYLELKKICDENIRNNNSYKKVADELLTMLEEDNENVIDEIVEKYKRMKREERFELNQKISHANNLQNELDNLGYNCRVFVNNFWKLLGVK